MRSPFKHKAVLLEISPEKKMKTVCLSANNLPRLLAILLCVRSQFSSRTKELSFFCTMSSRVFLFCVWFVTKHAF